VGQGINISPKPHSRPGAVISRFTILIELEYRDSHS
jgi:hypothetical protein